MLIRILKRSDAIKLLLTEINGWSREEMVNFIYDRLYDDYCLFHKDELNDMLLSRELYGGGQESTFIVEDFEIINDTKKVG